MLSIKALSKAYFNHPIFDNLSLTLDRGINYLVAPNGRGKSTLLKIIAGIEQKDSGDIYFDGKLKKFSNYGSYVPDKMIMYPFLTGKEFLNLVCLAKKSSSSDYLTLLNDLNITQHLDTPFEKMSLGTQKKFFVVAGFIGEFSCLLMDEPSNAIDKHSMEIIVNYLKQFAATKLILIATHDQHLLAELPGRIFNL